MDFETIRLSDAGNGVWELVLTHPPANALNKQMAYELRVAAATLTTDPDVRAVVLWGEGKVFFGGGDLGEMQAEGDKTAANLHEMTIDFHGALSVSLILLASVCIATTIVSFSGARRQRLRAHGRLSISPMKIRGANSRKCCCCRMSSCFWINDRRVFIRD